MEGKRKIQDTTILYNYWQSPPRVYLVLLELITSRFLTPFSSSSYSLTLIRGMATGSLLMMPSLYLMARSTDSLVMYSRKEFRTEKASGVISVIP